MKSPGGKLKSMKSSVSEEEQKIDPYVVLNDPRLKGLPQYYTLTPQRDVVVIDEKHYQREATSLVAAIGSTLDMGGTLVATKTVVKRADGSYALVDGATSWRAAEPRGIPLEVRVFGPFRGGDDIELEAQLFYVLNEMRPVTSDAKIRVHDGLAADLLRRVNKDKSPTNVLYRGIWSEMSRTGVLSATAACRGLMAFILPDRPTFGTSASQMLASLEEPLSNDATLRKAEEFLTEVMKAFAVKPKGYTNKRGNGAWSYSPTMVLAASLGYAKACLGGQRFTQKDIEALQGGKSAKVLEWATAKSILEIPRKERIRTIGNRFVSEVEK
jgi:hypothetical protein